MTDLLIGLVVISVIAAFIALVVIGARRQRAGISQMFETLARRTGLTYAAEDDGRAEAACDGFDPSTFAVFSTSSLGRIHPGNVVSGCFEGVEVCLFTHGTRAVEGEARHWFVAIVRLGEPVAADLVKGEDTSVRRATQIGGLASIRQSGEVNNRFRLSSGSPAEAAEPRLVAFIERVAAARDALGFPIDFQIRADRLALYPSARNFTPDASQLEELMRSAVELARAPLNLRDGAPPPARDQARRV